MTRLPNSPLPSSSPPPEGESEKPSFLPKRDVSQRRQDKEFKLPDRRRAERRVSSELEKFEKSYEVHKGKQEVEELSPQDALGKTEKEQEPEEAEDEFQQALAIAGKEKGEKVGGKTESKEKKETEMSDEEFQQALAIAGKEKLFGEKVGGKTESKEKKETEVSDEEFQQALTIAGKEKLFGEKVGSKAESKEKKETEVSDEEFQQALAVAGKRKLFGEKVGGKTESQDKKQAAESDKEVEESEDELQQALALAAKGKLFGEKVGAKTESKEKPDKNKEALDSEQASLLQSSSTNIKGEGVVEDVAKTTLSAVEAKVSIDKITALVRKMVDTMQVGRVEGKETVSMDLKVTAQVPSFLSGANLSITQVEKGIITISFTNLSESNLKIAVAVMEQRQGELTQLVQDLQAKNITIAQLQIGEQSIALPQAEVSAPTPPYFWFYW